LKALIVWLANDHSLELRQLLISARFTIKVGYVVHVLKGKLKQILIDSVAEVPLLF
jgi:hypothetical protein